MTDVPQDLNTVRSSSQEAEPLLQAAESWRVEENGSTSDRVPISQVGRFEYSIVYHQSYEVPTLYFNGFSQGMFLSSSRT